MQGVSLVWSSYVVFGRKASTAPTKKGRHSSLTAVFCEFVLAFLVLPVFFRRGSPPLGSLARPDPPDPPKATERQLRRYFSCITHMVVVPFFSVASFRIEAWIESSVPPFCICHARSTTRQEHLLSLLLILRAFAFLLAPCLHHSSAFMFPRPHHTIGLTPRRVASPLPRPH